MNLTHCVVHEVVKEAGESTAQTHYSTQLLQLSDDLRSLVEKLNTSFGGSRLVNARFDESPGKLFSQKFTDYIKSTRREADFLEYSQQVVGPLETVIQGKSAAKGGYLLICAYDDAEAHRHGIFLLRNTVGRIFNRTEHGFEVQAVIHLDTEHLAMACRINVAKYLQGAGTYLELTHRSENEVSAYFSDWIGAEETLSSRQMTASLQELLGSIERVDADTGEVASQAQTFERAYEHVRANPNKVVDIQELSAQLYGSPARLEEHAREQGIELESEFRYNSAALKSLIQLKASANGINLSFPRTALEDGDMYIEGEGEQLRVVIASPELAKRILSS